MPRRPRSREGAKVVLPRLEFACFCITILVIFFLFPYCWTSCHRLSTSFHANELKEFISNTIKPSSESTRYCDIFDSSGLRNLSHFDEDDSLTEEEKRFWEQPDGQNLKPCLHPSPLYVNRSSRLLNSPTYLLAVLTGGLNQMRLQTGNAVLIARILRSKLVVPVLSYNTIWKDKSEFADIFDVAHFKKVLKNDVTIVTTLPSTMTRLQHALEKDPPLHATPQWFQDHLLEDLRKDRILVLRGLDASLTSELPPDLQKLRCKVEFEALRFSAPIRQLGQKLVHRMAKNGRYLALHLRLEKDVFIRTGCLPGLNAQLDEEVREERKTKPDLLTGRLKMSFSERRDAGLCPLSASDVVKILKAMGVSRRMRVVWAGGEPFGGVNVSLGPILRHFPNLQTKESLSLPGELGAFLKHGNAWAALDFILCVNADVFMASHGGNMAHSIQGHRAFFGHRKIITPNKKAFVSLLKNVSTSSFSSTSSSSSTLSEEEVNAAIMEMHKNNLGQPQSRLLHPGKDVISYPFPDCMCQNS